MRGMTRRQFLKLSGLMAASGALAACAPKSILSTPAPATATIGQRTPQPSAVPLDPVPPEQLPDLATIVFNRLAFGARTDDREEFNALGSDDESRLSAWLEAQLDPDNLDDIDFEERYRRAGFETLDKSLEELVSDHIVNNPYDDGDDERWRWFSLPFDELVDLTFLRAVYSRKQLQEVLADFWHNHFNVYGPNDEISPVFVSYDRDVIRAHLFGNFRQMLEAMATHPSMLFYLNNRSNSDAGPNENFARELFELHTLGAENYLGVRDPQTVEKDAAGVSVGYVDNDVYEAARCFTGWRVDDDLWDGEPDVGVTGTFLYYQPWHDRFNKFVLGKYLPADQPNMQDGRDVLDLLAAHPGTAHHVCRKLCRRLISDEPPESIVQAAAQVFMDARDAPDQLRQVYRAILLSDEFRSTWGGKLKRPFEFAAAVMRAASVDFVRPSWHMRWTYDMMGQPLFRRSSPDGYPDSADYWANSMATLFGWNFIVSLIDNWGNEDEDGEGRVMLVQPRKETPSGLTTAREIVEYWVTRIHGTALSEAAMTAMMDFLRADAGPDEPLSADHLDWRLPATIELALMAPELRLR